MVDARLTSDQPLRPPKEEIRRRLDQVLENLSACTLCEWRCSVNRHTGATGICRASAKTRVFREMLHFGEEIDLIPSHVVYFSGCNFGCAFCISGKENDLVEVGEPLDARSFASIVFQRQADGAKNLNLLGGEPSIFAHAVLELALHIPENLPIVLNSNMYMSEECFDWLEGVVQIYLADLKFGGESCAQSLAKAERYLEVVGRNLRRAQGAGRLIVRHLVMPNHVQCCTLPCLEWLAGELPGTEVSLMEQYVPVHRAAGDRALGRMATAAEESLARQRAQELGLRLIP